MERSSSFGARVAILVFLLTSLMALGAVPGVKLATRQSSAATDVYQYPVLPQTSYNYANITLPQHFLVNDFPASMPGQNAVIDNDNTLASNPTTDTGATLGRVLFYEKKLSANGTTACASCHKQDVAFSDDATLSPGFAGGNTRRHAMSLANVRFYEAGKMFWDERADSLEDQALQPIQDPVEMGLTLVELVHIVEHQPYYKELFAAAFGDSRVTADRIARAIAQFERSMVSATSRYDMGRAQVNSPLDPFPNFTAQENHGKSLFMEPQPEAAPITCVTCHMSEAFVTSARFDSDPKITTDATNNGLDLVSTIDFGVMETTGNPADDYKFKVPSLRNIGVTGPYMHDGRFQTLEEVVDFYSNRINAHPNLDPRLRKPNGQPNKFKFNVDEEAALVAFLHTLTDTAFLTDVKYGDPFVAATDHEGRKMLDGIVVNGLDEDLCNSDDGYLEVDPSPTSNPRKQIVDMILTSTSPLQFPSTFKFLVEAGVTGTTPEDVDMQIQFYNHQTRRFDLMGIFASSGDDQFIEVQPVKGFDDYVHPVNREITARIKWTSQEFSASSFAWGVDVDTAVWVIR